MGWMIKKKAGLWKIYKSNEAETGMVAKEKQKRNWMWKAFKTNGEGLDSDQNKTSKSYTGSTKQHN